MFQDLISFLGIVKYVQLLKALNLDDLGLLKVIRSRVNSEQVANKVWNWEGKRRDNLYSIRDYTYEQFVLAFY
jgi:hypothetical protein